MKAALLSVLLICFLLNIPATAYDIVGEAKTKGIIFKDKIQVIAIDDPDIKGVSCYLTIQKKSLSFEDSSSNAIACRQVAPITGELRGRENVFIRSKNPFFKKLKISRFYDKARDVLIYLSYVTDTGGENYSHSISVVPIYNNHQP